MTNCTSTLGLNIVGPLITLVWKSINASNGPGAVVRCAATRCVEAEDFVVKKKVRCGRMRTEMSREKMIECKLSALMLGQGGASCIGHTIPLVAPRVLCPGLGTPQGSALRKSIKSTFGKLF